MNIYEKKKKKPKAKLIGADGNIYNLLGIATRALVDSGQKEESLLMAERVFLAQSYDEALVIIMDYVEIV